MIVSDTSTLMTLVMDEPEAPDIRHAIDEAGPTLISAATLVEFYIVAMGKGDDAYARASLNSGAAHCSPPIRCGAGRNSRQRLRTL